MFYFFDLIDVIRFYFLDILNNLFGVWVLVNKKFKFFVLSLRAVIPRRSFGGVH